MKNYDMKPIESLMSESIEELTSLINKKHKNNCSVCGQEFDMRDLSQVFAHEPCDGKHKDYGNIEEIPHSGSKRLDEKITWGNAKWWQLPLR